MEVLRSSWPVHLDGLEAGLDEQLVDGAVGRLRKDVHNGAGHIIGVKYTAVWCGATILLQRLRIRAHGEQSSLDVARLYVADAHMLGHCLGSKLLAYRRSAPTHVPSAS